MNRRTLKSSMMASVGYDADHATLEVEFRSGHVYHYFAVPRAVYQALLESRSKGRFFQSQINGVYPVTLVSKGDGEV